jgi:MYXO-CTERM domain-containing protein
MCLCAAALTLAVPASAQVTQTDAAKTPLPQPVPMAEADLVNNSWAWNANTMVNRDPTGANLNPAIKYGDFYAPPTYPQFVTGDAINLSGLFKWRKETIDPKKDAKTGPGYFSAKCGFTGELLLMGGNCQAQFAWYNVTDPTSKTPPAATEIYPFITGKPQDQLNCVEGDGKTRKTDGFCPLAWDNRHPYDLSILRWTPKQFPSGDISKDPRYKGGYVAFAVIGDPAKCPQNKYSMYEHNQRNASGTPWVTTLIYQSSVDPGGFYMAFEDLPMSAADWTKGTDGKPGADGDFNDFVFYVSGLTCAGGNLPCNTGQLGACSVGKTDCAPEGQMSVCRPVIQKGPEVCDNVDNDCDGMIDNGDGLCPTDKPICFQGTCVGTCSNGEFPCPSGLSCDDSGHCADPACAAKTCPAGTACRAGECVEPCSGVVCPYGQSCQLGTCVDPCKSVTCPADRVCEKGLCLSKCDCRGCDTGLSCGADGRCVDEKCATKSCANGTVCKGGDCIDPCVGVVCPHNGTCNLGTCTAGVDDPGTGATGSGATGNVDFNAGGPGLSFGGSGLSYGGNGTVGPGRDKPGPTTAKGCGCRVGGDTDAPSTKLAWLGALLGLGLVLQRRRATRA